VISGIRAITGDLKRAMAKFMIMMVVIMKNKECISLATGIKAKKSTPMGAPARMYSILLPILVLV